MNLNLPVRNKVILSVVVLASVIFSLISPLGNYIVQLASAPTSVKNVSVITKNNEIELAYDAKEEFDFDYYKIELIQQDGVVQTIETQETSLLITEIENGVEYEVNIFAVDTFGRESKGVGITLTSSFQIQSEFINEYERADDLTFYILANSSVVSMLSIIFSLWILGFSQTRQTIGTIVLFPTVAIIPILLFTNSVSFSINQDQNQFIFAALSSIGMGIYLYFLLLTMNILHTAHFKTLPLEQAAKASQFIFILISTYMMLIYSFGADLTFVTRLGLIIPLIFYFSYIAMWAVKEITLEQVIMRSLVIVILMLLAVVIFSIWPINYVYAMLASAVIFYIMLSISLEIRSFLGSYVWVEYSTLIVLITLLLVFTSSWGINGSLL